MDREQNFLALNFIDIIKVAKRKNEYI